MKRMDFSNLHIGAKCRYVLTIMFFLYLQQFQITCGLRPAKKLIFMDPRWVILNMIIVSIPFLILYVISRRVDIAILLNALICTIFSLINYHVLIYHGSPFLARDINNIGTALDVFGGYKFILSFATISCCIIFFAEIICYYWLYRKKEWFRRKISRKPILFFTAANAIIVFLCFFSPIALFQSNLITWSWEEEVLEYGYSICFCNSVYSLSHTTFKPEGYSADQIIAEPASEGNGATPDLFIIVNESLCDISQYADVPESRTLFEQMEKIPAVISGNAICPYSGGGTNDTEYELLTSNSVALLNMSAPFASMSMKDVNNVASYLKKMGYTSIAMHCRPASNYSRNTAYYELGFDQVILGQENFKYFSINGNRECLDSDNFKDMLDQYDLCENIPRFVYLLTFQNHGGYEQNDGDFDTVHVKGDYGEYTDDINEYLSSLAYSISAYEQLVAELAETKRPVVILMVGDHAPSFLASLDPAENYTEEVSEILLRTVPYYVWSNVSLNKSVLNEYATMTDLVPMLLKSAGMPLSSYYETILKMNQEIPVRTPSGVYMDNVHRIGQKGTNEKYTQLLNNYYYMEYNNIKKEDDYNAAWY